ncbi:hypothetical protein ANABIO32_02740 [Rossellomorea marisflavi]|uniref:hypothetical protein n=1 Tax=Rossellomorea marisflavi TaxID=189381 RepID=UPI0025C9FF35|nr:hypothetical protein [Rossellomorea marisflavi]GLI82587.1 hypothetical protein ANABIO32_02740 [Rossellomorea marisflavi]
MCVASRYINQLEDILVQIKTDLNKLNKKKAYYDKLFNEYYHKIETAKFNACEGYYLAKNFQDILQKRRLIKSELHRMKSLQNYLINTMSSKLPSAKRVVEKSKNTNQEWFENFNFSFSDIEEEVMH